MSIVFTPLYGIQGDGPVCYLLKLDELTIVLDCGWDDAFSIEQIRPLTDVVTAVDVILLSHPDLHHMGALPYLTERLHVKAQVIATLPVYKMGQMVMYDTYLSRHAAGDFDIYNLDNVDAAFGKIVTLKYQQSYMLTGKGEGVVVTPYNAGHLLGGAVWKVTYKGEDIVYAVDFNHRQERHLKGSPVHSLALRPAVLLTDATPCLQDHPLDASSRDKEFIQVIMSVLRANGNILVPTDSAGRVLELLLLLYRHWFEHKLEHTYGLFFLTHVPGPTIEFAKTQLEWMNDALPRALELGHANPFDFNPKFLRAVTSPEAVLRFNGPRLVLCSLASLECGFARQLLLEWGGGEHNAILLTQRAQPGTLAATLQKAGAPGGPPLGPLQLHIRQRVPLEGEELEEFRRSQVEGDAIGHGDDEEFELMEQVSLLVSDKPKRSSSGSIGKLVRGAGGATELLGLAPSHGDAKEDMVEVLIDGFEVPKDAVGPMFPFEDEDQGLQYDEYGAAVNPADFKKSTASEEQRAMEAMEAEEEGEEAEEVPTKVVEHVATLRLRAQVRSFDYEGRSDGRSLRTIIKQLAPRQLVLLHAPPKARELLRVQCAQELKGVRGRVWAPAPRVTLDLSPGYNTFEVGLSDDLVQAIRLRHMGGYTLGWIDSVGHVTATDSRPLLFPAAGTEDGSGEGGIFIGDVRLSEIKSALNEAGIGAEFYGGALVCNGNVLVKRGGDEMELLVEGPMSEDYYKIRDVVYGQYHVC